MDDQNKANNQFGEQPKKEQPTDTSSAAPVEVEPATDTSAMPNPTPVPPVQMPSQSPSATTLVPPVTSQSLEAPVTTPVEEEKKLEMPPQPELLEAPKKKNTLFIAVIAVAILVVLAVLGMVVYKALY